MKYENRVHHNDLKVSYLSEEVFIYQHRYYFYAQINKTVNFSSAYPVLWD